MKAGYFHRVAAQTPTRAPAGEISRSRRDQRTQSAAIARRRGSVDTGRRPAFASSSP